jgi:hypothetical protein
MYHEPVFLRTFHETSLLGVYSLVYGNVNIHSVYSLVDGNVIIHSVGAGVGGVGGGESGWW